MINIGAIIESAKRIMPKEVLDEFLTEIKVVHTLEASPVGSVLMGMYILEFVGFPRYVDEILDEEHKSIEQLRNSYHDRHETEKLKPSSGIILSLMVADMIARPRNITPAYKFEEMAVKWRTGPLLGIEPAYLNDDRIGRVMSAIGANAKNYEEVLINMIMGAGKKADIPLGSFILDTTILQLDGKFKDASKVVPGRGSNSFSQLMVSLVIGSGSRMPVGFSVLPGNTSDSSTLPGAYSTINRIADDGAVEIIMDRIYPTPSNILFLKEQEEERIVYWVSPLKTGLSKAKVRKQIDEAYQKEWWEPIPYRSDKEIKAKISPPITAFETEWVLTEVIKPDLQPGQKRRPKGSIKTVEIVVRCVYYRHELNAEREQENRQFKMEQMDKSLQEIRCKLNKRKYRDLEFCKNKLSKLLNSYSDVKEFVKCDISQTSEGVISLVWAWDYECIQQESKYDGIFALLTNYTKKQVNKNVLIKKYRNRDEVEVDFKEMKGLLDLERILFQRPERIDTYVFIKVIAFFVLTFMKAHAEQEGIKTTVKKIQESMGDMLLAEIQVLPLELKGCGIARDTELNRLFMKLFSLPDPYEIIRILDEVEIAKVDDYVQSWYESRKK